MENKKMKITKEQLKQIIKEELQAVLREEDKPEGYNPKDPYYVGWDVADELKFYDADSPTSAYQAINTEVEVKANETGLKEEDILEAALDHLHGTNIKELYDDYEDGVR